MEILTKNGTIEDALELSVKYFDAYMNMSCGTVETFRIMKKDIQFNIAIINDALSTGYWTGDAYAMLQTAKYNFGTAQKSLETNTLKFLGIR